MSPETALNILVVDDEPLVRTGLVTILRRIEIDPPLGVVLEAEDGLKAIQILNEHPIDLVFTDIVMPRLDGLGLLDWIVDNRHPCRCVVLSCHDDFEYVRRSFRHDVVDYLLKYDIEQDSVSEILHKISASLSERHSMMPDSSVIQWWESVVSQYDRSTTYRLFLIQTDNIRVPSVAVEKRLRKALNLGIDTYLADVHIRRGNSDDILYLSVVDTPQVSERLHPALESLRNDLIREYGTGVTVVLSDERCNIGDGPDTWESIEGVLTDTFYTGPGIYITAKVTHQPETLPPDFFRKIRLDLYRKSDNNELQILRKFIEDVIRNLKTVRPRAIDSVRDLFVEIVELILEIHRDSVPENRQQKFDKGCMELSRFRYLDELAAFVDDILANLDSNPVVNTNGLTRSTGIRRALAYIHSHYHSATLGLSEVADQLNYSHSYLSREFKKQTGQNLVNYINLLRLKEARRLIQTGNYYIYEVAEMVGFNNYNYFSKLYRHIHGCTPNSDLKKSGTPHRD